MLDETLKEHCVQAGKDNDQSINNFKQCVKFKVTFSSQLSSMGMMFS